MRTTIFVVFFMLGVFSACENQPQNMRSTEDAEAPDFFANDAEVNRAYGMCSVQNSECQGGDTSCQAQKSKCDTCDGPWFGYVMAYPGEYRSARGGGSCTPKTTRPENEAPWDSNWWGHHDAECPACAADVHDGSGIDLFADIPLSKYWSTELPNDEERNRSRRSLKSCSYYPYQGGQARSFVESIATLGGRSAGDSTAAGQQGRDLPPIEDFAPWKINIAEKPEESDDPAQGDVKNAASMTIETFKDTFTHQTVDDTRACATIVTGFKDQYLLGYPFRWEWGDWEPKKVRALISRVDPQDPQSQPDFWCVKRAPGAGPDGRGQVVNERRNDKQDNNIMFDYLTKSSYGSYRFLPGRYTVTHYMFKDNIRPEYTSDGKVELRRRGRDGDVKISLDSAIAGHADHNYTQRVAFQIYSRYNTDMKINGKSMCGWHTADGHMEDGVWTATDLTNGQTCYDWVEKKVSGGDNGEVPNTSECKFEVTGGTRGEKPGVETGVIEGWGYIYDDWRWGWGWRSSYYWGSWKPRHWTQWKSEVETGEQTAYHSWYNWYGWGWGYDEDGKPYWNITSDLALMAPYSSRRGTFRCLVSHDHQNDNGLPPGIGDQPPEFPNECYGPCPGEAPMTPPGNESCETYVQPNNCPIQPDPGNPDAPPGDIDADGIPNGRDGTPNGDEDGLGDRDGDGIPDMEDCKPDEKNSDDKNCNGTPDNKECLNDADCDKVLNNVDCNPWDENETRRKPADAPRDHPNCTGGGPGDPDGDGPGGPDGDNPGGGSNSPSPSPTK